MKHSGFHRTIVAIAMMLIGWLPSLAHDFEVDGVFYNKTSDNTVAVTYKGYSNDSYSNEYEGNVVIPSSVDYNGTTYSVTSIGEDAFFYCSILTSIEIPNGVTSIGEDAFFYCSILTSIEIPNGVTSIGDRAFGSCKNLTSIVVDAGNTKYDSRNGCNAIIETASNTLIAGCQNTIIPNSVTSIGDDAFAGCTSLASIQIPNSVTRIGSSAFSNCMSLANIQIPNSVTSIGDYAFYVCRSFTSIQIPNSVTSIGIQAFSSCNSLTSIEIPNSVTSIGWGAFYDCNSLTSIEIPNSVTSVNELTFAHCSKLTSVEIPNSVTSIGDWAFYYCYSLTKITCLATNPPTIVSDTFNSYSAELYVPIGCKSAYQSANYWEYFNIKEIPIILSTSIALNKTSASLKATETLTLVATILPENATDKSVTWKSSNEAVATVDANGKVTAVAVGEATITATTADGSNKSATCKVTVVPTLAESIALDKTDISLEATETATLIATVLPELATDKSVKWSSSNEAVATVDANGKVTAVAVGEATITATTADGSNKSATCKITVAKTLATSISLDKTSATLKATETLTLKATIAPATTTDKSVTWKSSNEAVATVDANGKVTAVAVGEATITATTTDGSNLSASCKVTVTSTLATSITLDYTEYEIAEKSDFQLTATILPESTTNKGVVWSSSDMWIASVDENGLVRAYSIGEAVITATTIDGSNLSASCKVTVVSSIAQSITLDKTEVSLEVTETAALVAIVLPKLASNKSVEWSSSNEAIAVVDENGVVTAISIGEAVITATTVDGSNLSASCKVTVIPTLAGSIELDKTQVSNEEKTYIQLTATILPEHTTNKEVAWSSSKKVIATVDDTGLVFVKSVGEVVITATTTDGSNLSASCYINVYSSDIDGIEGDDLIVATIGDNIVVKNAQLGSNVRVYAADGSIIASEIATDGDVVIEAPIKGVYIVSVNGKTFKVMVK